MAFGITNSSILAASIVTLQFTKAMIKHLSFMMGKNLQVRTRLYILGRRDFLMSILNFFSVSAFRKSSISSVFYSGINWCSSFHRHHNILGIICLPVTRLFICKCQLSINFSVNIIQYKINCRRLHRDDNVINLSQDRQCG